ncbi:hypothetical protein PENSUB_13905 [Penicillium subrubescens]|uniref:Uncharacterized protein n=1 Tax=Penicillium subrubescens TaxID=1316194 RepID=A0A1Q5UQ07_9EURO|nr:hypothetical protein PENSUB_13905 [Penicillium subrubescens]
MASNRNITIFGDKRVNFVNSLLFWSEKLSHPGQTIQEAVKFLHGFEVDFDRFRVIGEAESASFCFLLKCQIITHTIQDAIDILRTGRLFSPHEVAEILSMTAQHIGRLTLSKQDNVDLYAEHMDQEAGKVNLMWMSRKALPDAQQERQRGKLQEIWERLHFTMPDCDCVQCSRGPWPLKKRAARLSM